MNPRHVYPADAQRQRGERARIAAGVLAERKRCAELAEQVARDCIGDQAKIARHIARLIRSGDSV